MISIWAIIFFGVSVLAVILVHYSRPKIEFQLLEEYEQLVKEVNEWLEGGET